MIAFRLSPFPRVELALRIYVLSYPFIFARFICDSMGNHGNGFGSPGSGFGRDSRDSYEYIQDDDSNDSNTFSIDDD